MKNILTGHAKKRIRQRGFACQTIEYVEKHAKPLYAPGGAMKLAITKREVNKEIQKLKKNIHMLEKAANTALIIKKGLILTVHHNT